MELVDLFRCCTLPSHLCAVYLSITADADMRRGITRAPLCFKHPSSRWLTGACYNITPVGLLAPVAMSTMTFLD